MTGFSRVSFQASDVFASAPVFIVFSFIQHDLHRKIIGCKITPDSSLSSQKLPFLVFLVKYTSELISANHKKQISWVRERPVVGAFDRAMILCALDENKVLWNICCMTCMIVLNHYHEVREILCRRLLKHVWRDGPEGNSGHHLSSC